MLITKTYFEGEDTMDNIELDVSVLFEDLALSVEPGEGNDDEDEGYYPMLISAE